MIEPVSEEARFNCWVVLAAAAVLVLGALVCRAEEDLSEPARVYVAAHSTEAAEAKWLGAWQARVADYESSGAATGEEAFAGVVVFDWLADRRALFEAKKPLPEADRLELCRWYLLFCARGWAWPERIRAHLTLANFKLFIGAELAQANSEGRKHD